MREEYEEDFPAVQPIMQGRIWERFTDGAGPQALGQLIEDLEKEDDRFGVEGGSWTNDRSWVQGYEHVLGPMQTASAMFAEKVLDRNVSTSEKRYREALFHLMKVAPTELTYLGPVRSVYPYLMAQLKGSSSRVPHLLSHILKRV